MRQYNYHGVIGVGKTVRDAKQNAARTVERLVDGCVPTIYAHKGTTVVIYETPEGGAYTLIHPDSEGRVYSSAFVNGDVEEAAISHLLSNTRETGDLSVPDWVPEGMHDALRKEWEDYDRLGTLDVPDSRGEDSSLQHPDSDFRSGV